MFALDKMKIGFVIAAAALLSACASVPKGDPKLDAELKNFKPQEGKAGIYVYRNETMGAAIAMDVKVDGKQLGQTGANTYLFTTVEPGQHKLVGKAENDSELTLDAVAGKLYYVWQEVKMGVMSARNKLQLVDEAKGQAGVKETSLAASAN